MGFGGGAANNAGASVRNGHSPKRIEEGRALLKGPVKKSLYFFG